MQTKRIIRSLLLCGALTATATQAKEVPVHFVKTHTTEFVSGGGIETITLEIKGASFTSPFRWSVTVTNANGVLFFVERDDAFLDEFFHDPRYIPDCSNYMDCKKKWYFSDLVDSVLHGAYSVPATPTAPKDWELSALESEASDYLQQKQVAPAQTRAVIAEMKGALANGFSMFLIPFSPVELDSNYMYVPSLNYFVPYWND